MGHNISGIAINKNFENNTEELSKLLGVELQIENEIIFEEASENWKEEGYFDVYFSKNGTLVFANIDQIGEVIGTHFYEIDLDEKAYRFALKNTASVEMPTQVQVEAEPSIFRIEPEEKKEVPQQLFNTKTNSTETSINKMAIELVIAIVVILALLVGLIYVVVSVINLP